MTDRIGAPPGMRIIPVVILIFVAFRSLDGKDFGRGDASEQNTPPHIIFIIADDLGWNDVGFHGSNQIPTPNIDALAFNGLILNNYYVEPICTPSRSSLMTGKYPIHTGMQHRVLYGAEPRGLPIRETLLPQHLQRLGYATHIVGKWHLGSYKRKYTPTFRGFETHFGFWTGHQDYYDHTAVEGTYRGLDMREGMNPVPDKMGRYSTTLFADKAVELITRHNSSRPLFLYLAHAAVHSGNPYDPLPAPEMTVAKFGHISSGSRRKFAAMTNEMDVSIGRVVDALETGKMLENSIVIFTTDNGGPANGFNLNAASNWPLRGTKNTLWEGGVRGVALIWSPKIKSPGRVSMQMMHITDWLPTLYSAAGGDVRDLGDSLDGIDMWDTLVNNLPSKRTQIVHNIDSIYQISGLRFFQWKIIKGTTYNGEWDGWYGPTGTEYGDKYDVGQILGSAANRAISKIMNTCRPDALREIRKSATVKCHSLKVDSAICEPLKKSCLFDVISDPCERTNLADRDPSLLEYMEQLINDINKTVVPPKNLPWDPRADPKLWGFVWTNFADSYPDDFPDV